MTTIKRGKRDSHFTILKNDVLRDKRLSYKARGLLAYMLSFDDDWTFYTATLINHSEKDGKDSINTGLKELINFGYLIKEQKRDNEGRFDGTDWIVIESPTSDYPKSDFPFSDKSSADNPLLRSNNSKNNNIKNIEEEDYKRVEKSIKNLIVNEFEKHESTARMLFQVYKYLLDSKVHVLHLEKIIEYLSANKKQIIGEYIVQQHNACMRKIESKEGLYSYSKYFINGLKERIASQNELQTIETPDIFNKSFGIEELPQILTHDWLANKEEEAI